MASLLMNSAKRIAMTRSMSPALFQTKRSLAIGAGELSSSLESRVANYYKDSAVNVDEIGNVLSVVCYHLYYLSICLLLCISFASITIIIARAEKQ